MTNEEFDRKVEFLLNQQAKLDADMQRLEAAQTFTAQALTRLVETVSSLSTIMLEGFKVLDNKIQNVAQSLHALTESHHALTESHHALTESHRALTDQTAESQRLTDLALRNLAELMDRHLREGHHGGPLGSET